MALKTIGELRADFRGGAPGFRFVFVIAVFVVDVSRFAVFVVAIGAVDVSRFAVIVIAVFVVDVSGFAVFVVAVGAVDVSVVVSATGAVNVSGFAVRRARRDFAAKNEEGGDASDEQERERADGDEGRRGFRLVVVVFRFGHFDKAFFDFFVFRCVFVRFQSAVDGQLRNLRKRR